MSTQLTEKKAGHSPLGAAMLKISTKFFWGTNTPQKIQTISPYRPEDVGYEGTLHPDCLKFVRGEA